MCSNLGIGASLAAIFFALCIGLFLRRLQDEKKQYQQHHKIMTDAGLTDIKSTTKVLLFP